MSQLLTFDDVLIVPKFSTITSRKDVSLDLEIGGDELLLPVISSNMDTITGPKMAHAMTFAGGQAVLHRFCTIEENVNMLKQSYWCDEFCNALAWVSVGLGKEEVKRAIALYENSASHFVIDVAHGAQQAVVDQANTLRGLMPNAYIVVGNFATADSVKEVLDRAKGSINAVKVGVGPGSACTTRIKTGVGYPQFSAIKDIATLLKNTDIQVIADGGMKTPGDIAKAIGAGAHLAMLGGMLAGTDETPGEKSYAGGGEYFKKYRGSASKESYDAQGKDQAYITAEGESFLVPCKGPVRPILDDIAGGLRSAMTYVGARNLDEFRGRCEFVQISPATIRENGAHGKT